MADIQHLLENTAESAFLDTFQQASVLNQESRIAWPLDPEASFAAQEHLAELIGTTANFVGQSVRIVPLDVIDKPITAFYYATPYPRFGTQGYKPHEDAVFIRLNPKKATGTIAQLDLSEAKLQVTPTPFSRYRWDRGYFLIDVLGKKGQPIIDIEFVE